MPTIQSLFYGCVDFLHALAAKTGTTYEEINVIIFIILEPILFFVLLLLYIRKRYQYKKLKSKMSEK